MNLPAASADPKEADVDTQIAGYLNPASPRSFFLFAGAGSGKTRSLVHALEVTIAAYGRELRMRGKQIAVITYTNAACDEISSRLRHDPVIYVNTIHSFTWELIRGFDDNIRAWLGAQLAADIEELRAKEAKGRPSKASDERKRSIESKQRRIEALRDIKRFVYSPAGENRERDSLNHAEVIGLGAYMLTRHPLMQSLLIERFPIVLIDESQDTNKHLIDALFAVQAAHGECFGLGLFGDTMQRIFADGKVDLGIDLPPDWATPAKVINFRSPRRIVELVNKIRGAVDQQLQTARADAVDGYARLFVCASSCNDKANVERELRTRMAVITEDELWTNIDQTKTLILEHHMAARRMGFLDMFKPLYEEDAFKTAVLDGTFPPLLMFGGRVLPLIQAVRSGDRFRAMAILRKHCPLLDKRSLQTSGDQPSVLKSLHASVEKLATAISSGAPTFGDVLDIVSSERLLTIPDSLSPFVNDEDQSHTGGRRVDIETLDSRGRALMSFLSVPFAQIEPYMDYMTGAASFDTHQNVKGREFPRVMVVMDDEEAKGFTFSYDKLFGAKALSRTDLDNENLSKDSSIARTRRLFYVTCSRSTSSLALVAYSDNPEAVRDRAIAEGWFQPDEIELIGS